MEGKGREPLRAGFNAVLQWFYLTFARSATTGRLHFDSSTRLRLESRAPQALLVAARQVLPWCATKAVLRAGLGWLDCAMFIIGLGTATPAQRFSQTQCWEAVQASSVWDELSARTRKLLQKILLGDNGITTRHLALTSLQEAFLIDPDVLHSRFTRHAPSLASEAGRNALADAGAAPSEIDAVLVSTCTGYLCPGLTSYVVELLGLRPDVIALDLVGQGCGAALPNMSTAEALLGSGRCRYALSLCVEVCSAAFYLDEDPGVLVSACLFGDAAGGAVLSAVKKPGRRAVEWKESSSLTVPQARDLLRFEQRGGMLRNILTREVPVLAARHAREVFEQTLQRSGVNRSEIGTWILHAGGRDVLLALRDVLGLSEVDLRVSKSVLNELGNISSPFVYHVLQRTLQNNAPGGLWWMAAFGAGFSSHGALLEVE